MDVKQSMVACVHTSAAKGEAVVGVVKTLLNCKEFTTPQLLVLMNPHKKIIANYTRAIVCL